MVTYVRYLSSGRAPLAALGFSVGLERLRVAYVIRSSPVKYPCTQPCREDRRQPGTLTWKFEYKIPHYSSHNLLPSTNNHYTNICLTTVCHCKRREFSSTSTTLNILSASYRKGHGIRLSSLDPAFDVSSRRAAKISRTLTLIIF